MTISSQSATPQNPLFPNIKVPLIGEDGNIFVIMSKISKALKKNGVSSIDRSQFFNEVTGCNSYTEALNKCCRWVVIS